VKILKIILWTVLGLLLLLFAVGGFFFYKIQNGLPIYETDKPTLDFPTNQPAVLLFSKTTGFRHGESIDASRPVFAEMAKRNGWFLYETEEGGVFNPEQLKQFKVVIFNNNTGKLLNEEQQQAVQQYLEGGGAFVGIHGTGDFSHHWPWLEERVIGARFSHHPLNPQLQKADVQVEAAADSALIQKLPQSWNHEDEWYVFFSQPKEAKIVSYINGDKIFSNGNMLWIKDKNFGMGKYHPVAWHKQVGQGKAFYTSMGHAGAVWQDANFVRLLENAVTWGVH
jgi:uncharacterized protein